MKFLLFLLFPLSAIAGKSYQLEINVLSKLDSLPLKNVEVKLFEDHKLVQKLVSDENGKVVFGGLRSKKYSFEAIGDTSDFLPYWNNLENKKKKDVLHSIYLRPKEKYFVEYCEKLVDQFFENGGSAIPIDTTEKCQEDIGIDAVFPGGQANMFYFIMNYLNYPEESIELGEEGKVYLSFIVEPDGVISNIKVLRGVSKLVDQEAKRIIKAMPRWIPGVCNGRRVRTKMNIPLNFALS
jgi:TonB family protein